MTVAYGGSITLGQAIPAALSAAGELNASLGVTMPDLQARIDGLLALSISPPPNLAALVSAATSLLAALNLMLAAPIPDMTVVASLLADLQATMGDLTASLSFAATLQANLGTAGIHYYTFAGRAGDFGPQMQAQLSAGLPGGAGPSESIAGAVLLASDGGAIAALQAVLATP